MQLCYIKVADALCTNSIYRRSATDQRTSWGWHQIHASATSIGIPEAARQTQRILASSLDGNTLPPRDN